MFQQLVSVISYSSKTSQDLLLKTVKKPHVGEESREEKNKVLRERVNEIIKSLSPSQSSYVIKT